MKFGIMKKSQLLLVVTCLMFSVCEAQQIQKTKTFGGYKYSQDGKQLKMGQMVDIMEANADAVLLMKKAKSNNGLGNVIGMIGGFMVGWPVGTAIGGGDPNWALAGIGAGLIVVGIPISSSAFKNANKAVDLYNGSLGTGSLFREQPSYSITTNQNGLGLIVSF